MKDKLKSIFLLLAFPLIMFHPSCNDKKLDILPLDILTSDQIFESEAGITAYLASMYNELPVESFEFRNWGQDLANYTDESITNPSEERDGIPDGTFLEWWKYNNIRNVNDFMDKLANAKLSEQKKNSILGEAKFIRAFYYFALVKRYGGVPIVKNVQNFTGDNLADLQIPRNTEKEVWEFIAHDLDSAFLLLPEVAEQSGRTDKYAAMALKSRAMLYAASIAKYGALNLDGLNGIPAADANAFWQASIDAALTIINSGKYSLYNKNPNKQLNFTELFIDKDNPEVLFKKNYSYPQKIHYYDRGNLPFSIRAPAGYGAGTDPYLELVEQFEYIDGSNGKLKMYNADNSPIFYKNPTDLFLNKDPRCLGTVIAPFADFKGTVIDVQAGIYDQGVKWEAGSYDALYNPTTHKPDNDNGTLHIVGKNGFGSGATEKSQTGLHVRKYLDYTLDQSRSSVSDQSWIVFRLGEILLNYAEATMEMGDGTKTKWALNEIRNRAGIKLLDDSEVTLDRVRHERLVELAFENHRWWDYSRWRITDKVLNNKRFSALKPYYDIQQDAYRFEASPAGRWVKTFNVRAYYERIPPVEISKNPKLIQNSGY